MKHTFTLEEVAELANKGEAKMHIQENQSRILLEYKNNFYFKSAYDNKYIHILSTKEVHNGIAI